MPIVNGEGGFTTFTPTPQEKIMNDHNKQRRREHDQLVYDMAEVKKILELSNRNRTRSVLKAHQSRGGY